MEIINNLFGLFLQFWTSLALHSDFWIYLLLLLVTLVVAVNVFNYVRKGSY